MGWSGVADVVRVVVVMLSSHDPRVVVGEGSRRSEQDGHMARDEKGFWVRILGISLNASFNPHYSTVVNRLEIALESVIIMFK